MAKTDIEITKLFNDYIKHLNTLSTGSIVLLVTFLEKLFSQPEAKFLIAVSLISFLISIIGGISVKTVFTFVAFNQSDEDDVSERANSLRGIGIILLWLGFLIGISSLALFGILNLF